MPNDFTSSQGQGGANNPAHPVLIHTLAGTIFVGGDPIPYSDTKYWCIMVLGIQRWCWIR